MSNLSLEEVVKMFRDWRALKQGRSPIPSELWDHATTLVGRYEASAIIRALRINYSQYKE